MIRSLSPLVVPLLFFATSPLSAQVHRWHDGVREIIPGTEDVTIGPGMVLRNLDLTDGFLGGVEPGTRCTPVNLTGSDFSGSNLTQVDFSGYCGLWALDFEFGANLTNATFRDANLTSAYLYSTDLTGADLRGAILRNSDLSDATVTGADFSGADLRWAYLATHDLSSASFSPDTLYDQWTVFNDSFDPAAHGLTYRPTSIGDVDFDDRLTIDDVNMLLMRLNTAEYYGWNERFFDLNHDQRLTDDDLEFWVHDVKQTWMGDANLDGRFDSHDLIEVFVAGKFNSTDHATWNEGNWNGDAHFDTSDLVTAFEDGGYEQGPRRVSPVPEPSASLLSLIALACLAAVSRHRSSSSLQRTRAELRVPAYPRHLRRAMTFEGEQAASHEAA